MNDQEKLLQKLDALINAINAQTAATVMLVRSMNDDGEGYEDDDPMPTFLNGPRQ